MSSSERPTHLRFILFDGCEILDFAGPLQAFHEANQMLPPECLYQISHHALTPSIRSEQGVAISALDPLPDPSPSDLIFIPGFVVDRCEPPSLLIEWLGRAYTAGAHIASICTGAFFLGQAGLLDGRHCTTHWKRSRQLAERFPHAIVHHDRLFVEQDRIHSSAGISAGIDLALALIEAHHGPRLASQVAREMVLYLRRDSSQSQGSVYLAHRNHLHPLVHAAQDALAAEPAAALSIPALAAALGSPPRPLTRLFRQHTGPTIHSYQQQLRLDHARALLANPELSLDEIASLCGFADPRQLRSLFQRHFGQSASTMRKDLHRAAPSAGEEKP